MHLQSNGSKTVRRSRTAWRRFAQYLVPAIVMIGAAYGSEGGASVYPAGVETVMPGRTPAPGNTMFLEFNNFYDANELAGSNGRSLVPGFHLRVAAVALKLVHNWGLHLLGGTLVSTAALPMLDIHLSAPFGDQNKVGFGNADIENMVAYSRGAMNFWYGLEVDTPGFSYTKNALVNIGQHNYGTAPAAAFSYLPHHARTELSSKVQYIVNYTDSATQYRSGNEFIGEFDGMQTVAKNLSVGGNGYFYKQTTNDLQDGSIYLDGNQGRNVAFGPEIRYHAGHFNLILKYQKDFLTENRPVGNSLWFQFGLPIGHPHE